jgi:hypothetical protein
MLLARSAGAAPSLSVFVIAVAPLPRTVPASRLLGPLLGRHVARLNAVTRAVSEAAGARFVPLSPGADNLGLGSMSTYVAWAHPIAASMHGVLDSAVSVSRGPTDEELRQASLDALDILDSPPAAELDAIARVAKDLFGVVGTAVNLVDRDRTHMTAAAGVERSDRPRSESFCALTVELGGALVIEDTRRDPRVSRLPAVEDGILFYAGYPVEAPNGQRIGTLCLFDTEPRSFTSADESLLRELALRVQAELWKQAPALTR